MPVVSCKDCGYKLEKSSFIEMPDGSKRGRCPKCLAFVDIPAKTTTEKASEKTD